MTYLGHPYMVSNCRQCPFGRGGLPMVMNVACDMAQNEYNKCVHCSDKMIPTECPLVVPGGIKIILDESAVEDACHRILGKKLNTT